MSPHRSGASYYRHPRRGWPTDGKGRARRNGYPSPTPQKARTPRPTYPAAGPNRAKPPCSRHPPDARIGRTSTGGCPKRGRRPPPRCGCARRCNFVMRSWHIPRPAKSGGWHGSRHPAPSVPIVPTGAGGRKGCPASVLPDRPNGIRMLSASAGRCVPASPSDKSGPST